jgi:hypothetical protein
MNPVEEKKEKKQQTFYCNKQAKDMRACQKKKKQKSD